MRARLPGAAARAAEAREKTDMYSVAAAADADPQGRLDGERAERAELDAEVRASTSMPRLDPSTSRLVHGAGPNRPPPARRRAEANGAAKRGRDAKGGRGMDGRAAAAAAGPGGAAAPPRTAGITGGAPPALGASACASLNARRGADAAPAGPRPGPGAPRETAGPAPAAAPRAACLYGAAAPPTGGRR